jgi:hypothetical protein
MLSLPQLIEEDIAVLDAALGSLLVKSESVAALIIDKGGPLIIQKGDHANLDTTTMAALAAGSFCANQASPDSWARTTSAASISRARPRASSS